MNIRGLIKARRTARAAAGLSALTCTLALCTGCVGASASGTGATATATGVTAAASGTGAGSPSTAADSGGAAGPSAGATNGGGGGTGGSGGSGGSSRTDTCQVRYLHASTGSEQGAAGSVYLNIVFKNVGTHPCTMYGYPGVSLGKGGPGAGAGPTQVGASAGKNPAVAKKLITLQPGGDASATLQIGDAGNYPATTCDPTPTTYLMIYPPNTTSRLYVPFTSTACASTNLVTLYVQAVQAGTGS